jgi:hypothetical protein|tara:strand:+ start:89 stop:250 length:162 start_codon:yes stop_codon:yes gene_type:complete
MKLSTAINVLTKRAEDFYGQSFDWLIKQMDNGFDENLNVTKAYEIYKKNKIEE